jgi:hypothetical protein
VTRKRKTPLICLAASALLAAGCSSAASAPTAAHRSPPTTRATTTTTAAAPTTTLFPSAVPTTVLAPIRQAPGWSSQLTTLPPGGGFTSVSCLSNTFCIAVGGGNSGGSSALTTGSGVTVSWDGAAWSEPSVYYPAPANGPVSAPVLPAITCTSGPSCVIADGSGHVGVGNGTDWSAPMAVPAAPPLPANPNDPGPGQNGSQSAAVSCPTPSFCAVVDNSGQAYTLNDGVWGHPASFGGSGGSGGGAISLYQAGRVGVSCPTSSECTAVVGSSILDWNGSSWSQEHSPWTSTLAGGATDPTAIACPTTSWCAVVNGNGVSVRTDGGPWSAEQTIDSEGELDSISCPSASFCVGADQAGGVVTWNGSGWSAPVRVIPEATEYPGIATTVSCPNSAFCMVLNSDGDYATYAGM